MRSILFLTNQDGLTLVADKKSDLTILDNVHTCYKGQDWHIHVVKDTVEQDLDWVKIAAPQFGKVVHMVHHNLPRPEILNGLRVRIAEVGGADILRAPFDGMHEKRPDDLRCKPYVMLAKMLPALQTSGIDDELQNDFEELWQLLERQDRQVKVIGAYQEALASYSTSTPSKPLVSDAPLKLVGFPSEDAIRPLVGDDVALCSLQDAEVLPKDHLVVFCETDHDENGKKVSLLQLAGVEWVKKLRREGKLNPVLFVSALGRKELLENRPEFEILTALKHPFLKLDGGRIGQLGKDITKGLSEAEELDPLELEFVKQAYCSAVGLVQTMVHELYSVPEGDEFWRRAARVREDAYRLLEQGGRAPAPPNGWDKNQMAALDFIRGECNTLIAKQPSAQQSVKQEADAGWELLLLDDDIKAHSTPEEPHPFVRELEKERKLKVHLAGSSSEALAIINEDQASGKNQILLAVVDYHLREPQKDEVIGDQSEQGFHFLKQLAKEAEYIKPVVLTAMPRRFVMNSLRHLGVGLGSVFSKLDYFKEGNYALLADQVVELGNENAEAISRLPRLASETWKVLERFYLNHRRSPDYIEIERFIASEASRYCADIDNGSHPFVLRLRSNPFTEKDSQPSEKTGGLDPRRIQEFINILICRRVGLYYSQCSQDAITSPEMLFAKIFPHLSSEGDSTPKRLFNTVCALPLTKFPWTTTIEERNWLINRMGVIWFSKIETREAPVIASMAPAIRRWLTKHNISLKDEDSLLWGTLTDVNRWLIKCENQTRGNRLKTDSLDSLVAECLSVVNQHLVVDSGTVESLDWFRKRLASLRSRIGAWKMMPVDTPVSASELSAEEKVVLKVVLNHVDKPEHPEAESVAWEYFAGCRQKKWMPEKPEEAAKKILKVYRAERLEVDRRYRVHKEEISRDEEPEDPWANLENQN